MEKGLTFLSGLSCIIGGFKIVNGLGLMLFNLSLAIVLDTPEALKAFPFSAEDMALLKDMGTLSQTPFLNVFTLLLGCAFLILGIVGFVKRSQLRREGARGSQEGMATALYQMMVVFLVVFIVLIFLSGAEIFLIGW